MPGGTLAYDVAGKGAPILFVHSVIADRRMWDREVAAFAPEHLVIRYDLRGFGGSAPATGPYSLVGDVESVLAHVGVDRAFVVGSSMGGAIAVDFALAHPEQVTGLLLAAPGLSGGIQAPYTPEEQASFERDEQISKATAEAWRKGDRTRAFDLLRELWCPALEGEALRRWKEMVDANATEVFTNRSEMQAEARPAAEPRLPRLTVPTTLLIGHRDNPASIFFARRIAGAVPGGRLTEIPAADHLINLSTPEAFATALRSALASVR